MKLTECRKKFFNITNILYVYTYVYDFLGFRDSEDAILMLQK